MRLLILGGTAEASGLALALVGNPSVAATVSLAGRTAAPAVLPLPCRIGGFGGVNGLVRYLCAQGIAAVIDATHPFALRITANAQEACRVAALPLARFTRPPWAPQPGDQWTGVPDLAAAARALGPIPRTVFLTTGRLGLAAFRSAPRHRYLIRTIDPPDADDLPERSRIVLGRGPFAIAAETELMRREAIDVLVTKNSGGAASAAKLTAARRLSLPVILVEPPVPHDGTVLYDLPAMLDWIAAVHRAAP